MLCLDDVKTQCQKIFYVIIDSVKILLFIMKLWRDTVQVQLLMGNRGTEVVA